MDQQNNNSSPFGTTLAPDPGNTVPVNPATPPTPAQSVPAGPGAFDAGTLSTVAATPPLNPASFADQQAQSLAGQPTGPGIETPSLGQPGILGSEPTPLPVAPEQPIAPSAPPGQPPSIPPGSWPPSDNPVMGTPGLAPSGPSAFDPTQTGTMSPAADLSSPPPTFGSESGPANLAQVNPGEINSFQPGFNASSGDTQPNGLNGPSDFSGVAPSSLSDLAGSAEPGGAPSAGPAMPGQQAETLVVPPVASQEAGQVVTTGGGGFPKIALIIGGFVLLAVSAVAAYFILGIGQTSLPSSIIALPTAFPTIPQSIIPKDVTPTPPAFTGLEASQSATPSGQTATSSAQQASGSAIELLRQRIPK